MTRGPGLRSAAATRRAPAVDGYEILGPLRSGGMGQLYDVADKGLGRRAVLKVLAEKHRDRRDYAERVRMEARILAKLFGARVPAVFTSGELADGRPYFVMERLYGGDLGAELKRFGVLSVPTSVRIVLDLLDTLALVHARSIVHRDVKLENLFLNERGDLYLLDFGVARRTDVRLDLTRPGVAMGTVGWMAPEQLAGEEADERTDVYAAGLVLYQLVAGRGPFDGVTRSAIREAHFHATPAALSACASQLVPRSLDPIVSKALSKRGRDRFASARAMADALRDVCGPGNDEGPTFVDPSIYREGAA